MPLRVEVVAFAESKKTGWKVFVAQPMATVHANTIRYHRVFLIWLLFSGVVGVYLSGALGRQVTVPLERLVDRFRELESGKPRNRAALTGASTPREIRALEENYSLISGRLLESLEKLRNGVRERERLNAELSIMNGELASSNSCGRTDCAIGMLCCCCCCA